MGGRSLMENRNPGAGIPSAAREPATDFSRGNRISERKVHAWWVRILTVTNDKLGGGRMLQAVGRARQCGRLYWFGGPAVLALIWLAGTAGVAAESHGRSFGPALSADGC